MQHMTLSALVAISYIKIAWQQWHAYDTTNEAVACAPHAVNIWNKALHHSGFATTSSHQCTNHSISTGSHGCPSSQAQ